MKKNLIAIFVLSVSFFAYVNEAEAIQAPTQMYSATVSPDHIDHGDADEEGSIAWHLEQGAGKTIRLKLQQGTYRVSQGIQLKSHTRIKGVGKKTRIVATDDLDDHIFYNRNQKYFRAKGVHNVTLSSMTLKGKRTVRKNCVQIVAKNSLRSSSITMKNLHVRTCGRHGVHIKGANNVKVLNSKFYNNGQNIYHDHNLYMLRVTGATVNNIYTTGSSSNGISSTRLEDATLSKIVSQKNGNRGIRFGGGRNIVLRNSTFKNNGLLSEYNADGIVITSDDYDNHSRDVVIQSVKSTKHPGSGIAVDFSKGVVVKDVDVEGNEACRLFSSHAQVDILRAGGELPSEELDSNEYCL